MGRKREVIYYEGRLQGKFLTTEVCDKLENLLRLNKDRGLVSDLKNIIYDLPPSDVQQIKETKSNESVNLRKGTLENHQTIGVAYMYFAKRLVLGDSVGLGKTVEVCGLCNLLESTYAKRGEDFKFLYLTGKNLVEQAREELIKFTGNYVEVVHGDNSLKTSVKNFCKNNSAYYDLSNSVVATHSVLNSVDFQDWFRGFTEANGYPPFDLMVVDESGDILANDSNKIYKNGKFFASQIEYCILLNATTFEKELKMFYNQLSFVDDTFLPTKTSFQKEYEIMSYTGPYPVFSGKYKNQEKFRQLVSYRYFARTRRGSGAVMKNCSADVIVVPLSSEQKWLLKRTSMPNMVYDCPSYFGMGEIETTEETTPKLKALLSLLTEELRDEQSILIYSRYKEAQLCIQKALHENGIDAFILNGESSQDTRNAIIDKFKLGDLRVLITNVQKGLNFGNCNYCIFYTYDPNPNKMVQFEGRMTRSYNIENKHVYLLLSRGDELKTFKNVVADRAQSSDIFAGSDFSCVLSILLDEDKIGSLK